MAAGMLLARTVTLLVREHLLSARTRPSPGPLGGARSPQVVIDHGATRPPGGDGNCEAARRGRSVPRHYRQIRNGTSRRVVRHEGGRRMLTLRERRCPACRLSSDGPIGMMFMKLSARVRIPSDRQLAPRSALTWADGADFSASLAPIFHPTWHRADRAPVRPRTGQWA